MRIVRDAIDSITSMTNGYQDGFMSVLGISFFMRRNSVETVFSIANIIITWGMAFIVGYGVLRITLNIIWNIFFGRDFEWKLGIVEKLFLRLKPIQVQNKVEEAVNEDKEISVKRMKVIMKKRREGGGVTMGFKKFMSKLNANKWTILGVSSIVGVTALGAFGVVDPTAAVQLVTNLDSLGEAGNISEGVINAAVIAGTAGIGIKAVLGAGPESVDAYKARKEAKKALKMKAKENKANGTDSIEKTATKLIKIGLPKEDAYIMAKKGAAETAKLNAEAIKAKEDLLETKRKAKFAKKMSKLHLPQEEIDRLYNKK